MSKDIWEDRERKTVESVTRKSLSFGLADDVHVVHNKTTGEYKEVFVSNGETTGEAVSKGKFKK